MSIESGKQQPIPGVRFGVDAIYDVAKCGRNPARCLLLRFGEKLTREQPQQDKINQARKSGVLVERAGKPGVFDCIDKVDKSPCGWIYFKSSEPPIV